MCSSGSGLLLEYWKLFKINFCVYLDDGSLAFLFMALNAYESQIIVVYVLASQQITDVIESPSLKLSCLINHTFISCQYLVKFFILLPSKLFIFPLKISISFRYSTLHH